MRARRHLLLAAAAAGLGCSGGRAHTAPTDPLEPTDAATPPSVHEVRECAWPKQYGIVNLKEERNVPYAGVRDTQRAFDITRPPDGRRRPLVLVLHAGSWTEGDKSDIISFARIFASVGYTAVTANYRLVDGKLNRFPLPMSDARCVVRYLRRNSRRFDVDPDHIAVVGFSAGGHLASMLGVNAGDTTFDGDCPDKLTSPRVQGVVSFFGPQDVRLGTGWQSAAVGSLLGANPGDDTARARLASPITFVRPGARISPFLLIHGTSDWVVPVAQSQRMYAALQAAGVPSAYVEVPEAPHLFSPFVMDSVHERDTCTLFGFLKTVLYPVPDSTLLP